ncbi:hypothetical protein A2870_01745 [Candidatus Curtissbacteria bacterium RIFCSPHIGHO2_01_FULL_41_11]|uniref:NAD-dependent epimerase/dehydratase domain-containing protein n=1 Tax=Candidatus Curtissbacteria bacterium RIFCSPHIGHO2_01_FULL_41_11 TaxID=1797711 RepID=A0A1F5G570_9BACT|nr:MAG: hypothetical protein A2870_01745 [Candidatus Curtissbacteria bacterium RIFCSPHIGHO2_01_FULL_41_11]
MRNPVLNEDFHKIANSQLNIKKFAKKTILISGAGGMIGGYLTEFFLYLNETANLKIKVIAQVRDEKKAQKRFVSYRKRADFVLKEQNVIYPIKIAGGINYIIHAASHASPKYFAIDPVSTLLPNVIGTKNLLEIARTKKAEGFLFLSSGEIYGFLDKNQFPTKETDCGRIDPINIRSCYGESKRLGESMCISYLKQYAVPSKIARLFHTYGPGLDLEDGRVFADFTKDIIEGKNIVINSQGRAKRSFCYLSDATEGLLTVLLKGNSGEAYNVGNKKEEVTIKELAQRLVKIFPEKKLKIIFKPNDQKTGYLPSSIERSCPDTAKIERLGWFTKHTIENGFRRTVLSFT